MVPKRKNSKIRNIAFLLYSPRFLVSENAKDNGKILKIESASSLKAEHSVPSGNDVQLCDPITFDSLNEF
jgi:hypothetical protein